MFVSYNGLMLILHILVAERILNPQVDEDHEVDEAELDQIVDLTINDDGHKLIPAQRDLDKGSTETDAKE
jgi:hypothetical protein